MQDDTGQSRIGKPVTLRPARPTDCDRILAWQGEPGARRHSRNPAPPTRDEHLKWFAHRLDPSRGPFLIIMHGSDEAGFVRADQAEQGAEVAILVAADHRGAGVATQAIRMLVRRHGSLGLFASVASANEPSRRAFLAAGFIATGPDRFRYQPGPDASREAG